MDVKSQGTWYQVVIFGKTDSQIKCEKRSAILAKSLETDINSSSSSSENDENDSDDDLDDVSKDNDGGKKGIDDDNDDGNKGNNAGSKGIEDDNDGADDLNKEVSNMINSTSTNHCHQIYQIHRLKSQNIFK